MSSMVTLKVPEELKARMQEAAKSEGLTLTAWLTKAAEQRLLLGEQWPEAVTPELVAKEQRLAEGMKAAVTGALIHLPQPPGVVAAAAVQGVGARSLARMEREETQRNCRHPVNRRIGKGCGACGKDPL